MALPPALFRRPRRITITVPFETYRRLSLQSDEQGRSLSNLAAYLIEAALQAAVAEPPLAAGSLQRHLG
jgi:macrodomain Ter protein organizer (MatP/YcbG family)